MNLLSLTNYAYTGRNFILDLIFPIACLGCKKEGEWLCSKCSKNIPYNNHQLCPKCHKKSAFGAICNHCQNNFYLDGVLSAGNYKHKILGNLIKKLKYNHIKPLYAILANYLSIFFLSQKQETNILPSDLYNGKLWKKFDQIKKTPHCLLSPKDFTIIPVPLHKKRYRLRGFNQAELLAKKFSEIFNLNLSTDLIRIKHRKAQAKLNKEKRQINIIGSFDWQGKTMPKNIILIDDVTTTGATLNECARVLKQNGAKKVWGLVVARG